MIVPFAVLTVRGVRDIGGYFDAGKPSRDAGHKAWAFVLLASLVGFVTLVPWRSVTKYYHYRGARGDVRELADRLGFDGGLVFVRSEVLGSPERTWATSSYASAFALNPPSLDRDAREAIYALDLGPESRERLCRYFDNRPVWVVAGPELTGDGFQVVAGPIHPGNLEACRNLGGNN
jgi:hypothetical protein